MKTKIATLFCLSSLAASSLYGAVAVSNLSNVYGGTTYPQPGYSAGNSFTTGSLSTMLTSIDLSILPAQLSASPSDFTMTLYADEAMTTALTTLSPGSVSGSILSFSGSYALAASTQYTWIVSALGSGSLPIALTSDMSQVSPDGWAISDQLVSTAGPFALPAQFSVTVAEPIPEPTSAVLGLFGALGMLRRRRA